MSLVNIHAAAAATAMCLVSLQAAASIPHQCKASSSGRTGYNQGYDHQREFLRDLWNNYHYDCDRLEQFINAVTTHVPSSSSSSLYLRCRLQGVADATLDYVDRRYNSCQEQCFDDGAEAGDYYGWVYCGLYFSTTEETELGTCDAATQLGCENALRTRVQALCEDKASSDARFDDYVESACAVR